MTILGILTVQAVLAQTDESQKYMRGSLCMMMVEHPTLEYNKDIEQVFEKMDIPERFNSHDLGVRIIRFANDKDQQANITIFAKDNQLGKKFVSKWFGRNKVTTTPRRPTWKMLCDNIGGFPSWKMQART